MAATCYTYARLSRLNCLIIITGVSGAFNSSTGSGISGIRRLLALMSKVTQCMFHNNYYCSKDPGKVKIKGIGRCYVVGGGRD